MTVKSGKPDPSDPTYAILMGVVAMCLIVLLCIIKLDKGG